MEKLTDPISKWISSLSSSLSNLSSPVFDAIIRKQETSNNQVYYLLSTNFYFPFPVFQSEETLFPLNDAMKQNVSMLANLKSLPESLNNPESLTRIAIVFHELHTRRNEILPGNPGKHLLDFIHPVMGTITVKEDVEVLFYEKIVNYFNKVHNIFLAGKKLIVLQGYILSNPKVSLVVLSSVVLGLGLYHFWPQIRASISLWQKRFHHFYNTHVPSYTFRAKKSFESFMNTTSRLKKQFSTMSPRRSLKSHSSHKSHRSIKPTHRRNKE